MLVEEAAIRQLKNVANMPFVYKHIAVMPDVHTGIGATIGSVIATHKAIIPAAVGVDIGCGMMAVELDCDIRLIQDKLDIIRHSIERSIPVGFEENRRITEAVEKWLGWEWFNHKPPCEDNSFLRKKSLNQLGSLGGGNHFIEICKDENEKPWVMLDFILIELKGL